MRPAALLLVLLPLATAPAAAEPVAFPQDGLDARHVVTHSRPVLYRNAAAPSSQPGVELARLTPLVEAADAAAPALSRAAHLSITLGLMADGREAEQVEYLKDAEAYARRAVEAAPRDPDARFLFAAALGLRAKHEPVKLRMKMAEMILEQSETILELEPGHAGGLHLRGQLHAAGMRLNPVLRFLARTMMGAELLAGASWEVAEQSFREALEVEPDDPSHRLELVRLLRDTDREAEAAEEARRILESERADPLAAYYKRQARAVLAELSG